MKERLTGVKTGPPSPLEDKQGRRLRYLRLAVTQRCNLRCTYCMPASGVPWIPHSRILRYEEMTRLVRLLVSMGVDKVRLTGGEPFVRKGLVAFVDQLTSIIPARRLFITTNGLDAHRYLDRLAALGIGGINLSLDSLDRERYARISRRDRFPDAMRTLEKAVSLGVPLKINVVVLGGTNDGEIPGFVNLAKRLPIQVRFIEQMAFNGGSTKHIKPVDAAEICMQVSRAAGTMLHWDRQGTAMVTGLSEWKGTVGVIASRGRTFCGSCDRIRVTPTGGLQTCLYGGNILDLREMLRSGSGDDTIRDAVREACWHRFPDGHSAERHSEPVRCSMATIGG